MSEAIRHHYVPVFLLRSFAQPATDDGQLHVLDSARRKVFLSRPSRCGFRNDFNRVDPENHPKPSIMEDFYAKLDSTTAPVVQRIRDSNHISLTTDRDWLSILFALQLVRTPRFRRWLEGKHFQILEAEWLKYTRHKASRRRFAARQREYGL